MQQLVLHGKVALEAREVRICPMQCSKQRRRAWNLWDQGWAELALQEQLGRSRAAPRATAQTRCEGDQTPVRE